MCAANYYVRFTPKSGQMVGQGRWVGLRLEAVEERSMRGRYRLRT